MGSLTHRDRIYEPQVERLVEVLRGEICENLGKFKMSIERIDPDAVNLLKLVEHWESQFHELVNEMERNLLNSDW